MLFIFSSHVQVNNQSAIDFYKKFGFEIVETKEQYYKRIEPADAHVLMKLLRPQNNLSESEKWIWWGQVEVIDNTEMIMSHY